MGNSLSLHFLIYEAEVVDGSVEFKIMKQRKNTAPRAIVCVVSYQEWEGGLAGSVIGALSTVACGGGSALFV